LSFHSGPFIASLLERGADVNLQGRKEGSALRAAVVFPREHIIKLLLDRGADMHACQPGRYGSAFQLTLGKGPRDHPVIAGLWEE